MWPMCVLLTVVVNVAYVCVVNCCGSQLMASVFVLLTAVVYMAWLLTVVFTWPMSALTVFLFVSMTITILIYCVAIFGIFCFLQ